MIKANNFFFLAGVEDHIVAEFRNIDATAFIKMRHESDVSTDRVEMEVTRHGKEFKIKYLIIVNNATFSEGVSEPIPDNMIQQVIAAVANGTILP
ncbi:hypothetical protein [Salmonella phage SSBI34]|nr:hypothetical protein [Salmonella phage SSBI34]